MTQAAPRSPSGGDVPDPPAGPAEAGPPAEHEAEQNRIRDATLRLAEPEREALALAGPGELSHGEIAAIMDIDAAALPALIARARISLHEELFGANPASTIPSSEDCEQALPLIAMRDDGQLGDEEDLQWLLEHLAHCDGCRVRLDAMQRAGAAYDGWEPVAAPPALFGETIASRGLPQRNRLVTTGLLCLMLRGLSGIWAGATLVLRSNDRTQPTVPSAADAPNRLTGEVPARVQRPERRPRVGLTAKARKVRVAPQNVRIAPQGVVVIRPIPERPRSTPKKSRPGHSPRQRRTPRAEAVPLTKPTPPASQPAPTRPPTGTPPQPAPSVCRDPTGNPVPCPG